MSTIEHMQGVAGSNEKCVERIEITPDEMGDCAEGQWTPEVVIEHYTGCDWPVSLAAGNDVGVIATAANPAAANRSGEYCDYWMLTKEEAE